MELHKRFILLYMSPPERSVSGRKKKKESLGFPFLLFFPHLLPSFFCLTRIYERLRFCAILRRVSLMLVRLLNYEASDMHWIPLWMKINSGLEKCYTKFLDTFFFLATRYKFWFKIFFLVYYWPANSYLYKEMCFIYYLLYTCIIAYYVHFYIAKFSTNIRSSLFIIVYLLWLHGEGEFEFLIPTHIFLK